ncbi:MAG: TldD/PmbA family protein [Candidatus Odinarchaeota archaeon]|nr:TldD/PmbA family protein [Candidatus Odinarchaeota archaeon]
MKELDEIKSWIIDTAQTVIKHVIENGAWQADVRIEYGENYLTRFANSQIHQNVGETYTKAFLRVFLRDKRFGCVTIISRDIDEILKAADQALKIAKASKPDLFFKSLPEPDRILPTDRKMFFEEMIRLTPFDRAEVVGKVIDAAHEAGKHVSAVNGALSTVLRLQAIANSLGVNVFQAYSFASLNVLVTAKNMQSEAEGFAYRVSGNLKEISAEEVGFEAGERASSGLDAKKIEPGDYEVVFLPYATATLMFHLAIDTSARSKDLGVSSLINKENKKVLHEDISVVDDPRSEKTPVPLLFDGEGVPKRRLVLFDHGVFKNFVYDSYYAGKEGKKSTGHASFWRHASPFPSNLVFEPGNSKFDDLIEDTKNGILVSRLHYSNTVDPRRGIITAMTRAGTFKIENGELKYSIKNMRFTDSYHRILNSLSILGKDFRSMVVRRGFITAPSIKVNSVKFVGTTG